jgi:hypothetical protein
MKKSVVAHLIVDENQTQLHFNRRLPSLEATKRSHPFFDPNTDLMLPRPKARLRMGRHLAKQNAGQNPVEIGNPVAAYRQMLDGFANIDGLIHVHQVNPYTLQIVVGKLFNHVEIGRQVAKVISKTLLHCRLQFTNAVEDEQPQPKGPSIDTNQDGLISIRDL